MRNDNTKHRFGPGYHLFGLIAASVLCIALTGCGTTKPKAEVLPPVYKPAKTVELHFKRPMIVRTPQKDPSSVEEHIRCGLFYFDQESFVSAADEFKKACKRLQEPQNPLYRACLISAAVSHLLADDKPAFMKAIKELKSSYHRYQLMVIEDMDDRVKVLFGLYDELMKTGNF